MRGNHESKEALAPGLAFCAEVDERAPLYAAAFSEGMSKGLVELSAPGCSRQCSPCYRECVVRGIHARAWA